MAAPTLSDSTRADDFARWVRHNGTIATLGPVGTEQADLLRAAFLAGLRGEDRPTTGLGPLAAPPYSAHICRECWGGDPARIEGDACERCGRRGPAE